jgi:aminoglycoside phosphotransferase (APT) family kinase protein
VSTAIAPDDIVETTAEARGNSRPPLLVLEPLRAFLDSHGLGEGAIEASPIGEGHSNVTYLIRRGDAEMVLRRPPRPPLPPSAHDVLREARLLRALAGTPARVPPVLAVCDEPETIGCPFYVMERIPGEVIVTSIPEALDTAAERRRISDELIDALAEIHDVDWRGLWQADRLPGAAAAPLQGPVGAEQDARDTRRRAGWHVARAEHARVGSGDHRAR